MLGRHKVYSSVVTASWKQETFDMDVNKSKGRIALASSAYLPKEVDVSWLPAAAEVYKISPNIKDYVAVNIPIVTVDVPNRNLQAFPFEEVTRFDPEQGKFVYSTFVGKPTHQDHDNQDITKAKGIHIDANLQYMPRWGLYKINVLTLWDRTKDVNLVKGILSGEMPFYSMGAWVNVFMCSVCGNTDDSCAHMQNKGGIFDSILSYQQCLGDVYFETSNVGSPADPTAESNAILF